MRQGIFGLGRLVTIATLTMAAVGFARNAHAEDEFRCKDTGKIVSKGDNGYAVIAKCRRPDAIFTRVEQRIKRISASGRRTGTSVAEVEEVVIEEWTYDFGQNRLLVVARFEQDRLVSVEFKGYGEKSN